MHIKDLFIRRPWGEFMSRWETTSAEHRRKESATIVYLVAVGLLGALIGTAGTPSAELLSSSFVFWGWIVPSLIMTPFILWRIVTRICARRDDRRYGNFIWRDLYLDSSGFTPLHIGLYVLKAYWPLLNWVCVLAGMVSIARCEFTVACPTMSPSKR